MSPAEFCPFAAPSPQFQFVGCPLFGEGESRTWTLAHLKERLLEIGTLYLQCSHGMQVGPWYEQRQAFGARETNLAHFIRKFHAVDDSDRFRTAVRVKYRADLTAKLVDDVITDLSGASNGTLSISAAEKVTLGAAVALLQPPATPATAPAKNPASTGSPYAGECLSLDGLMARAAAGYAHMKRGFTLVACSVEERAPDPAADGLSDLHLQIVNADDPGCWRIVNGTLHLPFPSQHFFGATSINGSGRHYLILGAPRGLRMQESGPYLEFAKDAGAFLRANPPRGFFGGGGMTAEELWALLLLFWEPCAAEFVVQVGDCRLIEQPWAASLVALRALRGDMAQRASSADDGGQTPKGTTDGQAELTAVERALVIYARDPNQSVRAVARQVGCNHTLLLRDPRFQRLREAYASTLPRGRKSKDGNLEADFE